MENDLKQWATAAAGRSDVLQAVDSVYQDLAAEVAIRRPLCILSGRCCKFEEFGHRLFVTTMELASFVSQLQAAPQAGWDGRGCPFQAGKLCTVHALRPMGCRIFFCDASATQWQQQLYERLHARLKSLHQELGVHYAYVEWRQALDCLGIGQVSGGLPPDNIIESF